MKEPQNFSNWTDSDFDPSNRPRSISVEWWDENYVKPAREYREYYKRLSQQEKEWRSYPDPLLNPGCPLYWFSGAQDPSIIEIEEEQEENSQENQLSDESLAELNEQLQALRRTIVLPEVSSDVSATSAEAEMNMAIAEMDAYVNQVFEDASQELFKAYAETVADTREWETKRMDAGPTIGKKEQVYPGIRRRQLRNYFRTQMRPSEFALGAVASGTLLDIYDKKAVATVVQMIYQLSVSAEYWDVTPNMYVYLATDAGAIAYLEDVLEGKVIVPRVTDNKDDNFVWTDDEWSELSRYVKEWKANVTDFQRLCPGEKIPKATAQNKQIRTTLRNKMDPFYIEPSSEDVVRQHNQQLYESVNQIIEKVMSGESLPPEATREQQLLYEYYRSYYYYKVDTVDYEVLPGFEVDDVPERKITPEEIIDSLTNNQSSINHSIPSQSNLAPEDIDVEVVSVHDHPLDERVLEEMLCEIFAEYSNQ